MRSQLQPPTDEHLERIRANVRGDPRNNRLLRRLYPGHVVSGGVVVVSQIENAPSGDDPLPSAFGTIGESRATSNGVYLLVNFQSVNDCSWCYGHTDLFYSETGAQGPYRFVENLSGTMFGAPASTNWIEFSDGSLGIESHSGWMGQGCQLFFTTVFKLMANKAHKVADFPNHFSWNEPNASNRYYIDGEMSILADRIQVTYYDRTRGRGTSATILSVVDFRQQPDGRVEQVGEPPNNMGC